MGSRRSNNSVISKTDVFYPLVVDAKNEYKMQMFASGRYSVVHYLIHAMPPVSANAYMHFERNFRHGHVQLYCLTQWILTRAGHPKITSEHRRQHEGLQHKLRHGAPPAV